MTKETLLPLTHEFIGALYCAHELIEGFLRGDKLDTNRLEDYYDGVMAALRATSLQGSLISSALQELTEAVDPNNPDCFEKLLDPEMPE